MDTEELTIRFEAQLVSTSMTMNGGHKVTLRINPEDVMDGKHLVASESLANGRVRSLMTQSPNTRYMCVLVELGEETDEPVVQADAENANKAMSMFSMLCRSNTDWHRWLGVETEEEAVTELKSLLEIESRKELKTDPEALDRFNHMIEKFYNG